MLVPTGEDPIFRYRYGMDNWHKYCMKSVEQTDRSINPRSSITGGAHDVRR
jgi:hypothetical protein